MFGKGKRAMSSTDKFVMAAGKKVGNIKTMPMKAPLKKTKVGKMKLAHPDGMSKGSAGPVKLV